MTKMDENQQWAHEELKKLMKNSPTYEDQAFYRALEQLMLEQAQRLVNAAGESYALCGGATSPLWITTPGIWWCPAPAAWCRGKG